MATATDALQYVKNTNGGATKAHFIDDWDPIGDLLWKDLRREGWAFEGDDGRIYVTSLGEAKLKSLEVSHGS